MNPHLPAQVRVITPQGGRNRFLTGTPGERLFLLVLLICFAWQGSAQTCPTSTGTTLTSFPNTYFAGAFGTGNADISYALGTNTIGFVNSTTGYQSPTAGTSLAAGDQIVIIQMQGVVFNQGNTIAYGDGTTGAGYTTGTPLLAGLMEFNTVLSISGNTITLVNNLTNTYRSEKYSATGNGYYRYQIIKLNPLGFVTLGANISPPAWNGQVGGVMVLSAAKTLNFAGFTIDASARGFRGGGGVVYSGAGGNILFVSATDYRNQTAYTVHGSKGEGIAGTPRNMLDLFQSTSTITGGGSEGYPNGANARGAPGSGGGGGTDGNPAANDQNSGGGGGGGAAGPGGKGGNTWSGNQPVGGLGGKNLTQLAPNRLVMGGGGGAGSTNDGTGTPANGIASSGATGGGIVIIIAGAVSGTGTVSVNGGAGNTTVANDGSGGGGGAGSILMFLTTPAGISGVTLNAVGGNGGTNTETGTTTQHGPGGGGGGGVIYTNGGTPAATNVTGGAFGTTSSTTGTFTTQAYGATAGTVGFYLNTTTTANIPVNSRICQVIALPVTLTDFSGTLKDDNSVALLWHTTAEVDFSHFVVERSTDAISFSPMGEVGADSGDGSTKTYGYSDPLNNAAGDFFYYRLKMIDQDNSYAYSKTVLIRRDAENVAFAMYPNPVYDHVQFDISVASDGNLEYKIMDNAGRVLQQHSSTATKGRSSVVVGGLNKFAPGNYILQVRTGSQTYTRLLIKQ